MARRQVFLVAILLAAFAAPQAAFAHNPGVHDGEVIADGSDSVGNVFVSGGQARFNLQNFGDCPVGTTNCHIEIRWLTKCLQIWCLNLDDRSGWISVPIGQDFMQYCYNDGPQQWKVDMRLSWLAPQTITVDTYGEAEAVLEVNGLVVNRVFGRLALKWHWRPLGQRASMTPGDLGRASIRTVARPIVGAQVANWTRTESEDTSMVAMPPSR